MKAIDRNLIYWVAKRVANLWIRCSLLYIDLRQLGEMGRIRKYLGTLPDLAVARIRRNGRGFHSGLDLIQISHTYRIRRNNVS